MGPLESAARVTTWMGVVALLGVAGALVVITYLRRGNDAIKKLTSLDVRTPDVITALLEQISVPLDGMSPELRYKLVLEQLYERRKRMTIAFVCLLTLAGAAVVTVAIVLRGSQPPAASTASGPEKGRPAVSENRPPEVREPSMPAPSTQPPAALPPPKPASKAASASRTTECQKQCEDQAQRNGIQDHPDDVRVALRACLATCAGHR